jgi:hypothetical protein
MNSKLTAEQHRKLASYYRNRSYRLYGTFGCADNPDHAIALDDKVEQHQNAAQEIEQR